MDPNLIGASLLIALALVIAAVLHARVSKGAASSLAQSAIERQAELQSREAAMTLRRGACLDALSAVAISVAQVKALRDPASAAPSPDTILRLHEATERAKAIASPATAILFDQYVALFTTIIDRLGAARARADGGHGATPSETAIAPLAVQDYRRMLLDALPQLSALSNNLLLAVRKDFGFGAQSEHMLWQQLNKTGSATLANWRNDIEGAMPQRAGTDEPGNDGPPER